MNYSDTLADYDGKLCILYCYTLTDTPELARSFYPIGCSVRSFIADYGDSKVGQTVRALGDGTYQDRDGLKYRLIDGGRTVPVHCEKIPIAQPKVRKGIDVRWHNGQWEKYLKTQGWVTA